MLTSSHLPQYYGNSLSDGMHMLGKVGFNPKLLGSLPTFLSGPIPHVANTGLELAGIAAGLAASLGSIALSKKRKTRKYAKIAAGLGGLAGLASTFMGGRLATDGDYVTGGLDVAAGLAMLGASWRGWERG